MLWVSFLNVFCRNCCDVFAGKLRVTVYGDFLPRHVFYRLHALCAYVRCIYVAFCMIWFWAAFDIILVDQVSAVIPVFKTTSSKVC